ncbi:YphA family membrane protein [Neobacillus drentensis]|uniref:YphA family membrane protein n=1 Tax=Neobacillus drentensis TaxID=220684 RepID=UPI003000EF83
MEGEIFYWTCWAFWIYLTFLLEKQNPYRIKLAAIVLIVLILSNIQIKVSVFEIQASGLFILGISYLFISQEKRTAIIYYFICAVIISITYVTFHLFEIFDPIWIIFKKEWMMGIVLWYLAILLQKTLKGRLLILFAGAMQGEILYALILNKFQFPYLIGAYASLDVCSLTALLLVGWSALENVGTVMQNYFHFFEKGKQKSS